MSMSRQATWLSCKSTTGTCCSERIVVIAIGELMAINLNGHLLPKCFYPKSFRDFSTWFELPVSYRRVVYSSWYNDEKRQMNNSVAVSLRVLYVQLVNDCIASLFQMMFEVCTFIIHTIRPMMEARGSCCWLTSANAPMLVAHWTLLPMLLTWQLPGTSRASSFQCSVASTE